MTRVARRPKPMDVQYIVRNDKRVAVVIKIDQFHRWVDWIENLEDSLALKKAERTAAKFIGWNELKRELRQDRSSRPKPRRG